LEACGVPAISAIIDQSGREVDYRNTGIDILFPQTPYEEYKSKELAIFISSGAVRICYVPYSFMLSTQKTLHNHLPFYDICWKIFVECDQRRDLFLQERGDRFAAHVVTAGMPRIDGILAALDNSAPAAYWNFPVTPAHKRILWAPHHSFMWTGPDGQATPGYAQFHLYAPAIWELAESNPLLDIVIRPHPRMWGTMLHHRLMSQEQITEYKKAIEDIPNMRLDEGVDYIDAFWSSDALITDGRLCNNHERGLRNLLDTLL